MSEPKPAGVPAPASEGEKKMNPKDARKLAKQAEEAAKAKEKAEALKAFAHIFGNLPLICSETHRSKTFTDIAKLSAAMSGQTVTVRARVHTNRKQGKMAFLVLRDTFETIQAVVAVAGGLPAEMIAFAGSLSPESIVDVEATVSTPQAPIKATSKADIELQVTKLHVVSASAAELPFQYVDASRPDSEVKASAAAAAAAAGEEGAAKEQAKLATVGIDTRLNCRWMDMRTRASNALFRLESRVGQYFRQFLIDLDFTEIHTPKLIGAASEGGANVFKLQYFGKEACLAQSPQLYKQMVLQGDLERVFEVAPVFRAEKSFTPRHMTEFISLDVEMRINEHYYEVLDVAEELFRYMFDHMAANKDLLAAIAEQHPFEPIEYVVPASKIAELGVGVIDEGIETTDPYGARIRNRQLSVLRIPFPGGIALHNTAPGVTPAPLDEDISTDAEKLLGKLVKERYGVDYYIMDRYPAAARPFYTMPDPKDSKFSNSYDMFVRGQEIVSGAQRIHEPEMLERRARECGVDPATIKDYIDSFRLGAWPHGGFAIGLERIVFLYLGLTNVRYASIFPRDPQRCTP
jgi:nondiscriminating aspartyl-tRNA synthetase